MKKKFRNQKSTQIKERINLDKVALIGRTFEEYEKIFRLSDFKSNNIKILDVGSGVSSFCAEASRKGMNVTAIDPIYVYSPDVLENKCLSDLFLVINELKGVEHLYIWDIFKNKEDLRRQREKAFRRFIKHYRMGRNNCYISEDMPETSFDDNQFDIVISSHLLFLYDHIFDYNFHKNTIKEMLRICSKEIRIFPLVNLYGKTSPFLQLILRDNLLNNCHKSIERVDYEFIKGGNKFFRIIKN
ncbi:MAG: hypothetical protein ACFFHV_21630 [Promethearchaeota archaeon]